MKRTPAILIGVAMLAGAAASPADAEWRDQRHREGYRGGYGGGRGEWHERRGVFLYNPPRPYYAPPPVYYPPPRAYYPTPGYVPPPAFSNAAPLAWGWR